MWEIAKARDLDAEKIKFLCATGYEPFAVCPDLHCNLIYFRKEVTDEIPDQSTNPKPRRNRKIPTPA